MMNEKCKGYGLLILRVFIGIIFLAHGIQKLVTPGFMEQFAGMVSALPVFGVAGTAFAWVAALSETVGGLFLILGFLTPFAAAFTAMVMLTALFGVHLKNGFFLGAQPGFEYVFALLGACLAIIIEGPGKWSLDSVVCRKKEK